MSSEPQGLLPLQFASVSGTGAAKTGEQWEQVQFPASEGPKTAENPESIADKTDNSAEFQDLGNPDFPEGPLVDRGELMFRV